VTREERNVLLFVALGLVVGSWPTFRPEAPEGGRGFALLADSGSAPVAEIDADSTVAPTTEAPALETRASAEAVDLFPIDLNSATVELIEELPRIGPAKARAIVELRERKGRFLRVEELGEVRGIGPKTVPPCLQSGERTLPMRARPVPFCFQSLRPLPRTRPRVLVACVPCRPPARYWRTSS